MERTTHYNLVLFQENDKPTWLNNWNETMSHIDEVLYRISSGGGDLPDLSEVVARLEVLESQMTNANGQINQLSGYVSDIQSSIETINTTLVDLANADTTLSGRITGLEESISAIRNSLNSVSSQLSNISGNVSTLMTEMDSVVNRVSSNENNITDLLNRLSIIEERGSGMLKLKTTDPLHLILDSDNATELQQRFENDNGGFLYVTIQDAKDMTLYIGVDETLSSDIRTNQFSSSDWLSNVLSTGVSSLNYNFWEKVIIESGFGGYYSQQVKGACVMKNLTFKIPYRKYVILKMKRNSGGSGNYNSLLTRNMVYE